MLREGSRHDTEKSVNLFTGTHTKKSIRKVVILVTKVCINTNSFQWKTTNFETVLRFYMIVPKCKNCMNYSNQKHNAFLI